MATLEHPMTEFKPDRSLINSKFEGYKILLDSVNKDLIALEKPIFEILSPPESFDLLSSKINLFTKSFFFNKYSSKSQKFYYFSHPRCDLIEISFEEKTPKYRQPFCFVNNEKDNKYRYPSVHFLSEFESIVFDGVATIFYCRIDVDHKEDWKSCFSFMLPERGSKRIILSTHKYEDSIYISSNLLVDYEKDSNLVTKKVIKICKTEILRLKVDPVTDNLLSDQEIGKFLSSDFPPFFTYNPKLNACAFISDGNFISNSDDLYLDPSTTPSSLSADAFSFENHLDDVMVSFKPNVLKLNVEDFIPTFTSCSLIIKSNKNDLTFNGKLEHEIIADSCSWSRNTDSIKINLSKFDKNKEWKKLFQSISDFGISICKQHTPSVKDTCQDTDCISDAQEDKVKLPNIFDCEENSAFKEANYMLSVFSMKDEQLNQTVNLNTSKVLYACFDGPEFDFKFCIEYDVDGIVVKAQWNTTTSFPLISLSHINTNSALAYVLSSNNDRRFVCAHPHGHHIVSIDTKGYSFYYENKKHSNWENQRIARFDGFPVDYFLDEAKLYILTKESQVYIFELKNA